MFAYNIVEVKKLSQDDTIQTPVSPTSEEPTHRFIPDARPSERYASFARKTVAQVWSCSTKQRPLIHGNAPKAD